MSDKKHWIIKIVPALAFAAGIIMASIGGMMTVSSVAKLALFEGEPYSYISEDQCRYDYNKPEIEGQTKERSIEEIEQCVMDRKAEEISRFQNSEKQDIVDGLSALLIGGILILSFRKRK